MPSRGTDAAIAGACSGRYIGGIDGPNVSIGTAFRWFSPVTKSADSWARTSSSTRSRSRGLNPNSYNLTLHDELMVYEELVLDMRRANRVRRIAIPAEGLVLQPNQLYLGRTVERTETRNLVPMIEGRSSIGRLGLFVHVTAGFGDVGFCGYWTLEMFAVQPVRIYAGVAICQIFYHDIRGSFTEYHSDKYQHNTRHPAQPALQGAQSRRRRRSATETALRHRAVAGVMRSGGGRFSPAGKTAGGTACTTDARATLTS